MRAMVEKILGGFLLVTLTLISTVALAQNSLKSPPNSANEKVDSYLSPDGKYEATTIDIPENQIVTYLTNTQGKQLTSPQLGSFVSWAPDSSKVLLYVASEQSKIGRRIYYLDIHGTYKDFGLPTGTISADISAVDGSIVFSQSHWGSDVSDIYVKKAIGSSTLLLSGENNILTWVRWSPDGSKILFMKSDEAMSDGKQSLWVMGFNNSNSREISQIDWDYPAVWAHDGKSIVFAKAGDIWRFEIGSSTATNLTKNIDGSGTFKHPEYSASDQLTFISRNGNVFKNESL